MALVAASLAMMARHDFRICTGRTRHGMLEHAAESSVGFIGTSGKGLMIAGYASKIGIQPYFAGYQCAWIGLGPELESIGSYPTFVPEITAADCLMVA